MSKSQTYLWLVDERHKAADVRRIVEEEAAKGDSGPYQGVVVAPTHIGAAEAGGATHIISVAGFPTGRHHGLIKASEARLAVQSGASEVWVSVDDAMDEVEEFLPDLVTIREACPEPVELGMFTPCPASGAQNAVRAAHAAELAGFDRVIVPAAELATPLQTSLATVVLAPNSFDEATVASWLNAGAAAVAHPAG